MLQATHQVILKCIAISSEFLSVIHHVFRCHLLLHCPSIISHLSFLFLSLMLSSSIFSVLFIFLSFFISISPSHHVCPFFCHPIWHFFIISFLPLFYLFPLSSSFPFKTMWYKIFFRPYFFFPQNLQPYFMLFWEHWNAELVGLAVITHTHTSHKIWQEVLFLWIQLLLVCLPQTDATLIRYYGISTTKSTHSANNQFR